jgi:CTP:molybdopterin cytidylyltransferase MocA/diadenosine tetraphosphate (Ap4A) HIT family hydrolase
MRALAVVILAAGKGTRMPPDLPKVLRPLAGRPLLAHVLATARMLAPERIVVVLGHGASAIEQACDLASCEVALQTEQRGTGDAVRRAQPALSRFDGDLLVLYGDVPLLRATTLNDLRERHAVEENAATILTATLADPAGYGRIVRDRIGFCAGIVEQRDLQPDEAGLREINSGVIVFDAGALFAALGEVQPDNRQGEYYLTSVIGILRRAGERVGTHHLRDESEILGVNTLAELDALERHCARLSRATPVCPLCAAQVGLGEGAAAPDVSSALLLGAGRRACVKVATPGFNNGQLTVFPRRHVTSLITLTREERAELGDWLQRGERALRGAYGCDAFNVGCNSESSGHLAFDLVPRWCGDVNYLPLLAGLKLVPERPEEAWRRLREAWA